MSEISTLGIFCSASSVTSSEGVVFSPVTDPVAVVLDFFVCGHHRATFEELVYANKKTLCSPLLPRFL